MLTPCQVHGGVGIQRGTYTRCSGGWRGTVRLVEQMSNQGCRAVGVHRELDTRHRKSCRFQEPRMQRGLREIVGFELVPEDWHCKCRREGEKTFQNGLWRGSIRDHWWKLTRETQQLMLITLSAFFMELLYLAFGAIPVLWDGSYILQLRELNWYAKLTGHC